MTMYLASIVEIAVLFCFLDDQLTSLFPRDAAYLQTQLLIAQKEEAKIQLQAEEYDLMYVAADIDEIEEVNANCILMANLQQASTSGTLGTPDHTSKSESGPTRFPKEFGTVGLSAKAHHKKTKKVCNALIHLGKSAETALEPEYAAAAIEPKAKGVNWLSNRL
ncbi:hypothetical protein Tco_1445929 [Tanacetum coccineum]